MLPEFLVYAAEELQKRSAYLPSGPTPDEFTLAEQSRSFGRWLEVIIAVCLIVFTSLLWIESDPSLRPQALPWALVLIFIGLVIFLMIVQYRPGVFWWLFLTSPIVSAIILNFLLHVPPDNNTRMEYEIAWVGLVALFIAIPLLSLVLTTYDLVPISYLLARLAYLRRYRHLSSLDKWAERNGWNRNGPSGVFHRFWIQGIYRGLALNLISARKRKTWTDRTDSIIWMTLQMPFAISGVYFGTRSSLRSDNIPDGLKVEIVPGKIKNLKFIVWDTDDSFRSAEIRRLAHSLYAGTEFLSQGFELFTRGNLLIYRRFCTARQLGKAQDLQVILDWMNNVMGVLRQFAEVDELED